MAKLSIERKDNKLYVRYYHNGGKVLFNTEVLLEARYWDKKAKRVRHSCPQFHEISNIVESISKKVRKLLIEIKEEGQSPTHKLIKQRYFGTTIKAMSFWKFFALYLREGENNKKKSTISNYRKLERLLLAFEKFTGTKVEFENIDIGFYNRLKSFFVFNGYGDNYFSSNIKSLKAILNDATERNFNKNFKFKSKKFCVRFKVADAIYLTETELLSISNLDLKGQRVLQNCRDAFIIGCYTGLRFSDLSKVNSGNIHKGYINIRQQKTEQWVSIPFHPLVSHILLRHGGMPKVVDQSDFNKQIKKVGALAGIGSSISNKKAVPKFQLISSHTMRRSFATNLHNRGLPLRHIMQFTGHRSLASLEKYLKGDLQEASVLLKGIWEND